MNVRFPILVKMERNVKTLREVTAARAGLVTMEKTATMVNIHSSVKTSLDIRRQQFLLRKRHLSGSALHNFFF